MKKLFLFAGVAMIMASCANDEDLVPATDQQKEIKIGALCYGNTRNDMLSGSDIPVGWKLYVSAITAKDGVATEIFKDCEFSGTTSNNQSYWYPTDGTKYYYPLEGDVDFMGYSTSVEHTPAVWNIKDGKFDSVEIDFGTNLDGTEDVVCSSVHTKSHTQVYTYSNTSARLSFKHALAQVQFAFHVNDANLKGTDKIKITSVTLNNIAMSGKMTGTIDYTADSYGSNHVEVTWECNDASKKNVVFTQETYDMPGGSSWKQTTYGSPVLVPGNQTPESFTLVYELEGTQYSKTVNFADVKTINLLSGKRYVFDVGLTFQGINVTSTCEVFSDGEYFSSTIK